MTTFSQFMCPKVCANVQESAIGDEEEQVLALLLSKGAAETALADEMGRLRVQEEVRLTQMLHVQCLLMH